MDSRNSLSPCCNTLLYSTLETFGALCSGSLRIVRGAFEFLNPAPLEKARHPYSEFQAKGVDFLLMVFGCFWGLGIQACWVVWGFVA